MGHILSDLTCWGENPSSPYGMYQADDLLPGTDGPLFHVAENEALVFWGCSPPKSRYFGVQSYGTFSSTCLRALSLSLSLCVSLSRSLSTPYRSLATA